MSRRSIALTALAVALLAPSPGATAADPPVPEFPRANCAKRLIDPADDSFLQPEQKLVAVDGLDLTSVHMRLTEEQIQVFLGVKDIKKPEEMGPADGAYQYRFTAKYGEKNLTFQKYQKNTQAPWGAPSNVQTEPTGSSRGDTGTFASAGAGKPLPSWTGTIYPDKNYVVFTASRAELEAIYEETLTDASQFTGIVVEMKHFTGTPERKPDVLNVTGAAAVFTVDDYCFGPPPGQLLDLVTPVVAFGDTVQLKAKLTDEAGTALAGKPVRFTIAGEAAPVTVNTDANGIASAPYTPKVVAGKYAVTAQFLGDAEVGKAKAVGEIVVAAEKTAFKTLTFTKPSATTRYVTSTLVDDDGKAVSGVKVDWYVNGRKVSTLTSDSNGKTIYKGAKPTQTVYAKFVGVTGKYVTATSKSLKLT